MFSRIRITKWLINSKPISPAVTLLPNVERRRRKQSPWWRSWGEDHSTAPLLLHGRRLRWTLVRLRTWHLRRRYIHGVLSQEILPRRLRRDEAGQQNQQLLQVQQPASHPLHLLPLHFRLLRILHSFPRHHEIRPSVFHARWRCIRFRRRRHRRRRNQHQHAHLQPHPSGFWRWFHQSVRLPLLVGNGTGKVQRSNFQRLRHMPHRRDTDSEHRQLRRPKDRSWLGLENLPRRRRSPLRLPSRRRTLHSRDPHQHNPARRRSQRSLRPTPETPRHRRRGQGAGATHRRRRRCSRINDDRHSPSARNPWTKLPSPACDWPRPPHLPATRRHQLGRRLRSGDVPHHRAQGKLLPAFGGCNESYSHGLQSRGDAVNRPAWTPPFLLHRWARIIYIAGDGGQHNGSPTRRPGDDEERVRTDYTASFLPFCFRVFVVMGAVANTGAQRDPAAGGPISGAEHWRGCGFSGHGGDVADHALHALLSQMGDFLLLRRVDAFHYFVCVLLLAGNQRIEAGGDGSTVEAALVLEEVCGRRRSGT